MARLRLFPCNYWDDPDIEKMNPSERLLYACLWTNPLTTESGIYKITIKKMCDFTAMTKSVCEKALQNLEKNHKKVFYDTKTQTIFVKNFTKRNLCNTNRKRGMQAIYNDFRYNRDTFLWEKWQQQYPLISKEIKSIYSDFLMGLQSHYNDIYNHNHNHNINNKEKEETSGRFKPPTIEEVKAFCVERKNNVDPVKFWHFYNSKGWMVGKNKMKSWQSAMISQWERQPTTNSQKLIKKRIFKSTAEATDYLYNEMTPSAIIDILNGLPKELHPAFKVEINKEIAFQTLYKKAAARIREIKKNKKYQQFRNK